MIIEANTARADIVCRRMSGEAYLSNAVIGGSFVLRAPVLELRNFRGYTSLEDIKALPPIVTRIGKEIDSVIRPEELKDNR